MLRTSHYPERAIETRLPAQAWELSVTDVSTESNLAILRNGIGERRRHGLILDQFYCTFPSNMSGLHTILFLPALLWYLLQPSSSSEPSGREWIGKTAPEIIPGEWINATPLALRELRGKVVLIEFWTYGCYNCRNTLPYVKSWHKKFSPDQFRIIGVHTPEFESEKDIANLRRQVKKLGIEFAVVSDNNSETWRAYNQRYWPVMYLLDKGGIIRNVQIGEGGYEVMEGMIGKLIREGG